MILRDSYSFKSENFGVSIYMDNIFYGHAHEVNGLFLLNLDSSDTHVHNIDAKRCKLNYDNPTYLWQCRLGHIGVKRMKNSIPMEFWIHLTLNHLKHLNHALWAR